MQILYIIINNNCKYSSLTVRNSIVSFCIHLPLLMTSSLSTSISVMLSTEYSNLQAAIICYNLILSENKQIWFWTLLKGLYLSKFVSIPKRIDPSNKETDFAYGNKNSNSTIFNLTSYSDELNWSLPSHKILLSEKRIVLCFFIL